MTKKNHVYFSKSLVLASILEYFMETQETAKSFTCMTFNIFIMSSKMVNILPRGPATANVQYLLILVPHNPLFLLFPGHFVNP